ncbi:basic proline-rich protein-like [Prinia subflava]|uniref:basic proline-rich protein-like n=1 Tax=Prinia subflava TaxID=208062 RepID=UPI002FE34D2A
MRFTFVGAEITAKANAPAHRLRLPLAPGWLRPPRAAPREPARPPGCPAGEHGPPHRHPRPGGRHNRLRRRLRGRSWPGGGCSRTPQGGRTGEPGMNTPTPACGAGIRREAAELLPAPAGGPLFSPPKTPPPGSPALSQAAARPTGGERRGLSPPAAAPSLAPFSRRTNPLRATADRPAPRTRHGPPARDAPRRSARRLAGRDPSPPSPRQECARRGCPERRSPPGKVTPRRQSPRPRHRGAGRCPAAPRRPGEAPRGAAGGRRKTAWRPQPTAGGLRYRTAAPTGHPRRRRGRSGRRGHRSGAAIRGAQQAAEFSGSQRDDPAVSGAGHGAEEGEATQPNHLPELRGSAVRMLPPGAAREPAPLPAGSSAPLAPSAAAAARDRAPRAPPPPPLRSPSALLLVYSVQPFLLPRPEPRTEKWRN